MPKKSYKKPKNKQQYSYVNNIIFIYSLEGYPNFLLMLFTGGLQYPVSIRRSEVKIKIV